MTECPLDCVVPHVRPCKVRKADWPQLLLLRFPYRCESCKTRFHRMPEAVSASLFCIALVLVAYPVSYTLRNQINTPAAVQKVYWPIDWLLGQTGDGEVASQRSEPGAEG